MPKAERGHSAPATDAQLENTHWKRLREELEFIDSHVTQLRWVVFAHRELMRHMLERVTADYAQEVQSSYQLCRLAEDRLEEVGGMMQRAIAGVLGAWREENAHG